MAQMTNSLAQAILNGDGFTRHEVEQLARHWLQTAEDAARLDYLISTGHHVWSCNGKYMIGDTVDSELVTTDDFETGRAAIDAARNGGKPGDQK